MSDHAPDQPPGSPGEQSYVAPPPGYGAQSSPLYLPPQQPHGQYPPGAVAIQPAAAVLPAGAARKKAHRTRNIILAVAGAVVLIGAIGAGVDLLVSGKPAPASNAGTGTTSSSAGTLNVYTWYTNTSSHRR
jgi:hypothetical protein